MSADSQGKTHREAVGPLGGWQLTSVLLVEVLALTVVQVPLAMKFTWWAFADQGANLVVQNLLDRGLRPTVDFGYLYGLLPLALGRLWFGAVGASPATYQLAVLLINAANAFNWARALCALRVPLMGQLLLICALPQILTVAYPNFAHAIEAALLSWAIAEHACGRKSRALAIVTACCFAKPSMAYVYGLWLAGSLLVSKLRATVPAPPALVAAFIPAAVTGIAAAFAFSLWQGLDVVANTLIPTAGFKTYAAANHGFLTGHGRNFWAPSGARLGYYIGTAAGFWLACTAVLLGTTLYAAVARRREIDNTRFEFGAAMACLHVVFVTLFFGNAWSWAYYGFLLVIGTSVASMIVPGRRAIVSALLLLAILGTKSIAASVVDSWRTDRLTEATGRLWTSQEEAGEWSTVMNLTRGRNAAVLSPATGVSVELPGFLPPAAFFLSQGLANEMDIRRQNAQLQHADVVVVPVLALPGLLPADWPEFQIALERYEKVYEGRFYKVFGQRQQDTPPTLRD